VNFSLRESGQISFHFAASPQNFTFAARQTLHIPRKRDISLTSAAPRAARRRATPVTRTIVYFDYPNLTSGKKKR